MKYDIFFSISQTPVDGYLPSEREMYQNFFAQAEAADALGFGTAWLAESHLSSEVQKRNPKPVIPHWKGEVGLNVDFLQMAHQIFARTKRIEAGSAITNILCNGGPVAHAERTAAFLSLHGLDGEEQRRIHLGFAAGRFDFMNRAYGIKPRSELEELAWPVLKGLVFRQAATVFCRLLRGDVLSAEDLEPMTLQRAQFRTQEHWDDVQALAGGVASIPVPPFYDFETLQIVPRDFRRDLLQLVIGSHDPSMQEEVNQWMPVQVFNLSITQPTVIEDTHQRMARAYHADGGPWQRSHMPRTTFVFLNEQPGLSPEQRRAAAKTEVQSAMEAYWTALQGTIDPERVTKATANALVGDAEQVAQQMVERFHPEDRLMLWFDFFNHDNERVIANMTAFMTQVVPRVEALLQQREA